MDAGRRRRPTEQGRHAGLISKAGGNREGKKEVDNKR